MYGYIHKYITHIIICTIMYYILIYKLHLINCVSSKLHHDQSRTAAIILEKSGFFRILEKNMVDKKVNSAVRNVIFKS